MKKLNKATLLLTVGLAALLWVSGCTIEGGIGDEIKNKHITCTDTRDGETFGFNSNNITNVRVGFGTDSSFDVVDDSGIKRTQRSSMELFLKCVEDT